MTIPQIKGYATAEKIGAGSYASVYKAFKKDGSREVVAIKCVDKSKLSRSATDNIVTEITLLKVLKHDNIVEMKDFQWDDRFIYIIMEFCDGGDLSGFIQKRKKLPESACKRFLQQLALALQFLRSHNVCHMDLKPQNLLLTTKPRLALKLGDCRDLLTRLLQYNPDERISYEDFFNHPFLDLEHRPSQESYEKAVQLVCEAVKCDADKKFAEAYSLYCDSLKYFIPLINEEIDVTKKSALRSKVNCYITRAEELKMLIHGNIPEQSLPSQESDLHFSELKRLCSITPSLANVLEIGKAAELYMAEGQYGIALEKFEACLGVLVPALGKEPKGRRRDLLHYQVQQWLKAAELSKMFLQMNNLTENSTMEPKEWCKTQ